MNLGDINLFVDQWELVDITAVKFVPCSRFVNILKNTPGPCGFYRPPGSTQMSKAEIIRKLVQLNIPVYEVDAKRFRGQRRVVKRKRGAAKKGKAAAAAAAGGGVGKAGSTVPVKSSPLKQNTVLPLNVPSVMSLPGKSIAFVTLLS